MINVISKSNLTEKEVKNLLQKYSYNHTIIDYEIVAVKTGNICPYTSYTIFLRYKD